MKQSRKTAAVDQLVQPGQLLAERDRENLTARTARMGPIEALRYE